MNTAMVITKTEPETKRQAQEVAQQFGIKLSSLLNAYMKQIVRTRRIEFTLEDTPSDYLVKTIKQAVENRKQGKASPIFKNPKDTLRWLEQSGI